MTSTRRLSDVASAESRFGEQVHYCPADWLGGETAGAESLG